MWPWLSAEFTSIFVTAAIVKNSHILAGIYLIFLKKTPCTRLSIPNLVLAEKMTKIQKQSSRGFPRKRCSENTQQIYRRTPVPKCDFNKVVWFQNTFFKEHLGLSTSESSYQLKQIIARFCKLVSILGWNCVNPLNSNPTKWSNTLKHFLGKSRWIVWVCLTILWGWRLKGWGP